MTIYAADAPAFADMPLHALATEAGELITCYDEHTEEQRHYYAELVAEIVRRAPARAEYYASIGAR